MLLYTFLRSLAVTNHTLDCWKIELNAEDQPLHYKIDTGTEVTAISESAWKSLRNPPTLTKTIKNLCGPDHKPLQIVGEADADVRSKQKCSSMHIISAKKTSHKIWFAQAKLWGASTVESHNYAPPLHASIRKKLGGGLHMRSLHFRVMTITNNQMPHGRAIFVLSLTVWWAKLEKVRLNMTQMARLLAVAILFLLAYGL